MTLSQAKRNQGPILVGVDGSVDALRAVEWAAIRAWAGHTSLHVVHALEAPSWLEPQGLVLWWHTDPGDTAYRVLDAAVQRAHELVPGLRVTAILRGVTPSVALLDEGRTAELIVLGHGGARGSLMRLHLRRHVLSRVGRRARGRVVVVGPDGEVLV